MDDADIPGTLNVGHALPCLTEALIFVAIITLDLATLVSMIGAAVLGAWLGAGVVALAPRRVIQIGMGLALLSAAILLLAKNLAWLPAADGSALGLHGGWLWFAVGGQRRARCSHDARRRPVRAVPDTGDAARHESARGIPDHDGIVCAADAPSAEHVSSSSRRYNPAAALGLALGGVPGVLCAAFIVRSLSIEWLRWLVVIVVIYAAVLMLLSARTGAAAAG